MGTIASSSLEQSNVELADQLTQMIVAQRAYQANTKVIFPDGGYIAYQPLTRLFNNNGFFKAVMYSRLT